jgi:hypothetical protein
MNDSEKSLAAALAKAIVALCVRNTFLEDLHAGTTPSSKTGDYLDVKVVTPYRSGIAVGVGATEMSFFLGLSLPRTRCWLKLALLSALPTGVFVPASRPDAAQIEDRIQQLGSPQFAVREAATRASGLNSRAVARSPEYRAREAISWRPSGRIAGGLSLSSLRAVLTTAARYAGSKTIS